MTITQDRLDAAYRKITAAMDELDAAAELLCEVPKLRGGPLLDLRRRQADLSDLRDDIANEAARIGRLKP